MQDFQFLKYQPTPNEKHLGIATVKAYGKIILRYKIIPTKDGSSFFPCAASYKMPDDSYISAFILDSNSENEELTSLIKTHIKKFLLPVAPSTSLFGNN